MANNDKKEDDDLLDDFPADLTDSNGGDEEVDLNDFPDMDFPDPSAAENNEDISDDQSSSSADSDFSDMMENNDEVSETDPEDDNNDAVLDDEQDWPEEDEADYNNVYDEDGNVSEPDYEDEEEDNSLVGKIKKQAIPISVGLVVFGVLGYMVAGIVMPSSSPDYANDDYSMQQQPPSNPAPSAPEGSQTPSQNSAPVEETTAGAVAPDGLPVGPTDPGNPANNTQMEPSATPALPGSGENDVSDASQNEDFNLPSYGEGENQYIDENGDINFDDGGTPSAVNVPQDIEEPSSSDFVSRNEIEDVIFNSMESVVGHHFNDVLNRMDNLSMDVSDISFSLNEVSSRIDNITYEIDDVRENVINIDDRMVDYEDRLSDLEEKINDFSINNNVARNTDEESDASEETVALAGEDEVDDNESPSKEGEESNTSDDAATSSETGSSESDSTTSTNTKTTSKTPPPAPSTTTPPSQRRPAQMQRSAPRSTEGASIAPPAKPMVVQGYYLKGVSRDLAWIDTGNGIIRVGEGQEIEGLGRVRRISRSQDDWIVTTDAGLILP